MAYTPPADRKFYDPDLETLHDGVPPWMMTPLMRWLQPFLEVTDDLGERYPNLEFIEGLEMNCRLLAPLDRTPAGRGPSGDDRGRPLVRD